ncbi:MAG: AraC family transcriptional regulator, partial [Spirillospora sp.]
MDLLSDVVTVMRSGRPTSARVAWHAPWGQQFPSVPGSAGFQVILRGSCWLIPPTGDPVAVGAGDVLFFPHGHGYGLADSPSRELALCDLTENSDLFVSGFIGHEGPVTVTLCGGFRLAPGRAHPLLRDLPDVLHLPARLGHHHTQLRAAVDLLGDEIRSPHTGADTVVLALLDVLLVYILRAWFAGRPVQSKTGWAAALSDPAISAALLALHRDPSHPWTVKSLADQAGLSRAAFAHRFATLIGQPPLAYLTWWRLTLAARLLRDGDAPLSEIAAQIGYASEFSFANAFKRAYRTAPG